MKKLKYIHIIKKIEIGFGYWLRFSFYKLGKKKITMRIEINKGW